MEWFQIMLGVSAFFAIVAAYFISEFIKDYPEDAAKKAELNYYKREKRELESKIEQKKEEIERCTNTISSCELKISKL